MNEHRGSDSVDTFFAAMADRRRRCVLYYLRLCESATADEIAATISGEGAAAEGLPGCQDFEDVATTLYHVDVPKLERANLVAFDPETRTVEYRVADPFVEAVVERSYEHEHGLGLVPGPEELG